MIIYHGGSWIDRNPHFKESDFSFPVYTLQSFAHDTKKIYKKYKYIGGVFCDCGAFSAWSRGKKIDLQEYINFIHKHKNEIDVYAALDSIGDPKKTWQNYKEMRKQGLNPLPTFHYGEDFKWLERYTRKTNYIAIGGVAKMTEAKRNSFIRSIFTKYGNPNEIGFHGFGITAVNLINRFPWRSIDSTTATLPATLGRIVTEWGSFSVSIKSPKQKIFSKEVESYLKKYCKNWKINWEDLFNAKNIGYIARIRFNVYTLEKIAKGCPTVFKEEANFLL